MISLLSIYSYFECCGTSAVSHMLPVMFAVWAEISDSPAIMSACERAWVCLLFILGLSQCVTAGKNSDFSH